MLRQNSQKVTLILLRILMNASFRITAKHLFLTYPQCNVSKDRALALLKDKLEPWKPLYWVVGQERHQDGNLHLHCCFKLEQRCSISKPDKMDIDGFHGNYQSAVNWKNVVKYCTKHGDYVTNYTPQMLEELIKGDSKTPQLRRKVGEKVMNGTQLSDLVVEYPQLMFGYKRFKEDIEEWKRDKEEAHSDLPLWIPNDWGFLLPLRDGKKRHWWIYSTQPDRGKTTWAKRLCQQYRGIIKGGDFTYWNIRGDEQLIILDEYNTARLKWDTLNQLADGTFEFRVFQGGLRRITTRFYVIVLSNQPLSTLYPNMNLFLYARFIEKEIL